MSKKFLSPTTELVNRKKMYHSKKGWMVAGITTATVTGMVLLGTVNVANADEATGTTGGATSSESGNGATTSANVTTPSANTTAVTTASGSTNNGDGYSVNVDNSGLQSAVEKATATGVQVTQGQTTSSTVTADQAQSAVDSIGNSYKQQTAQLQEATAKQEAKNKAYATDTADASATNASNKAKVDKAVQDFKNVGGKVKENTAENKNTVATIDNYDKVKADVNAKTDTVVNTLEKATAQKNAENKVKATVGDASAKLDEAVNSAKQVLGESNVHQTDDVSAGKVTSDSAEQISNKIESDYASQIKNITTTVEKTKSATEAVGSIDKSKLEQAVKNAQGILGNDNVKQGETQKITATVDNYKDVVTNVQQDYNQQVKTINDAMSVGEKVNSANNQLSTLIDKYNELAKEVGQKALDKNTSKSVASLSDSTLNKQKADLQKQIDILQAQVDAQKEAEYMDSALKNAYDGKFSTTAKNVKLVLKYPNNTLNSTMNNGSVANSNGLELSFDIGSEGLKKGDTIKVFTAKFSGNDQYWNNQNSFKFPSGSEVYDEDGNKVGNILLTNERTGDDGYKQGSNTPLSGNDYTNNANSSHDFFIQLTKDISRVGKQHLVVNIKDGHDVLQFIGATPYASMGLDEIHSTLTFTDPDGHKLADDIHINLTKPTEAHEIKGQAPVYIGETVRPTWTNFHPALRGVNGTLYASDDENKPSDKIGKNADEVAKSVHPVENYAFTSHIENKDGSPLFMARLDELSRGKFSVTSSVGVDDIYLQIVDANNNLTSAVIKVNTGNNDTNTNIEAKNVIHAEDNLSEQQLSQRLDKNKFMIIYSIQDDNSYNLAYNLPSDLVKQWIDKFATPELFKKMMVSWDLGYYGDPDKVIENTINYVKNSHYVPVSIGATTGWNYYNNPNKANTLLSTINQVSVNDNRSPIKASHEITSTPSQELQSGQSGIILHYIDGLTGHEMKVNDTSIGDVGSNQNIEPNELFGYELTTEGAKYPSGVKTIETDTTVKYPSDGTWTDYYIVYMPLDVNAVGGLYEKPTVDYHLDSVTVDKPSVEYHYDIPTYGSTSNPVVYNYNTLSVDKPVAEKASYNLQKLNVLHKAGKTDSEVIDNQTVDTNGKTIVAGDHGNFTVTTDALQASTNGANATRQQVVGYTIEDTIDPNVEIDLQGIHVSKSDDGSDLTKNFNISYNASTRQLVLTANKTLVDAMSSDLTKTYSGLTLDIPYTAKVSGATFKNQAKTYVNHGNGNIETVSNKTENKITDSKPTKSVSVDGNNANGKNVITNSVQEYTVNVDYTKFKDVPVSDSIKNNEVSFTDTMVITNKAGSLKADSVKLVDGSGKVIDKSLYTETITTLTKGNDETYAIKFVWKDGKKAVQSFGGQTLKLTYQVSSNDGVTGSITNSVVQNNFGVNYGGNITTVNVVDINPKKDVYKNIGDTKSVNGEIVPFGSDVYFKITSSELPANRASVVKEWNFTDTLDNKVSYNGKWQVLAGSDMVNAQGQTVIRKNDDISKYFTFSLNGQNTKLTPNADYLALANLEKNRANANSYNLWVGATVKVSGWEYNTATETLNGDVDKTNTVKTFSYEPVNPIGDKDDRIGQSTSATATSANGMNVTKGDKITYELKGQALPQYHDPIKTFSATDIFDPAVNYTGFKAFMNVKDAKGKITQVDVTDLLQTNANGNTVEWTAKDALIKMMNSDKYNEQAYVTPTIYAFTEVLTDKDKIDNSYFVNINGKQDVSNIVTNQGVHATPTKDETVAGTNSNGRVVIAKDHIDYDVTWDLSQYNLKKTAISDEQMAKGMSVVDTLTATTGVIENLSKDGFKLVDGSGKAVSTQPQVTLTKTTKDGKDVYVATAKVTDVKKFLETYGGEKLHLKYTAIVADGKNGEIKNVAQQIDFNNPKDTPVVGNTVVDTTPVKDVVSKLGGTESLNGKKVDLGSTVYYKVSSSDLPANRASQITTWTFSDKLDDKVEYNGQWAVYASQEMKDHDNKVVIKKGQDISKYFQLVNDGQTLSLVANQDYMNLVNEHKDNVVGFNVNFGATVKTAGWAYNTADENLNGAVDKTNQVKTFSYDPVTPEPNKEDSIGKNTNAKQVSINGKLVTKGDTITYALNGQVLKQYHEPIKTFSANDIFDKGLTYTGYKAMLNVTDKDGKVTQTDVTDHMKEQVNGNTVAWVADAELIKMMNSDEYNSKAGVTPTVYAYATVNTDQATRIDNAYWLNINGKQDVSNIVTNTPTRPTPVKAETINGKDGNSKVAIANDQIDYNVTWDLSKYASKTTAISAEQLAKGTKVVDTLTATQGIIQDLKKENVKVVDAKGKAVDATVAITKATKDGKDTYTITVTAKDPKKLIETYGGQKLSIKYSATVQNGKAGDIKNQASQVDFGNDPIQTNVVGNTVVNTVPVKDVTKTLNGTDSLNGKVAEIGSTVYYQVSSSNLPANRASNIKSWTFSDKIDSKAKLNGQWAVFAKSDLKNAKGNVVIKNNQDISRYFRLINNVDSVSLEAQQDFLDLVNLDVNKATNAKFTLNLGATILKSGFTYNTANEVLNGANDKTNTVKTFAFDPIVPHGEKDVKLGNTTDTKAQTINGKNVVKGETLTYELKGQTLQQYHEIVKSFNAVDEFDSAVKYTGFKALLGDKDVTKLVTVKQDGNKVTWTANADLIKLMNSDEFNTKAGVTPTIFANVQVVADGVETIDNKYVVNINDKPDTSNTVENKTVKSTPTKSETVAGKDANGKIVLANDKINYKIGWDLSNFKLDNKLAISDATLAKGLSLHDTMTADKGVINALAPANEFKLVDANGKEVDNNLYTIAIPKATTKDGKEVYAFDVTAKDPKKFLQTYGGQKLTLTYDVTILDGVNGSIDNKAVQNDFGTDRPTPTVGNKVVNTTPVKDVLSSIGGKSVNGQVVPKDSVVYYQVSSSDLPANRATQVTDWTLHDVLDSKVAYKNFEVRATNDLKDAKGDVIVKKGDNISKYFTVKANGQTIDLKANADYVALLNLDVNKQVHGGFDLFIGATVKTAGWSYNTADETLNNVTDKTNQVKHFSFDPVTPKPTKDVALGNTTATDAQSINGAKVTPGSTLTYELKGQALNEYHEKVESFSATDTFDDGVDYQGYKAYLNKADGSQIDVTNHLTAKQDGNTVVWTADAELIKMMNSDEYNTKASETPTIYAQVKVNGKKAKTIENNYFVDINNKHGESNKVTNDSVVPTPVKKDLNSEGIDINGLTVLPGSTNVYTLTMDFDQYKDAKSDADAIAKGFAYLDDFPEEALDVDTNNFTYKDSQGSAVSGITATVYNSISDAPEDIQASIKENGINVNGAFVWFSVDNPTDFFNKYVVTGNSITITAPMTVKKDVTDGTSYSNVAYQFDFGKAYQTETVTNNVSRPNPTKDVVISVGDTNSLNNGEIKVGQTFNYELNGGVIKQATGTPLEEYGFTDDYDQTHDTYNGTYVVKLNSDVTLKDGKVLKSGTDVTEFTDSTVDTENGKINIEFKKDFLKQVDLSKGDFSASAYVSMTRTASGDVDNTYINTINGVEYTSNTVTTHTPEVPKTPIPEKETPVTPSETPSETPVSPKAEATPTQNNVAPTPASKELPQMSDSDDNVLAELGLVAVALAGGLGLAGYKKRKDA